MTSPALNHVASKLGLSRERRESAVLRLDDPGVVARELCFPVCMVGARNAVGGRTTSRIDNGFERNENRRGWVSPAARRGGSTTEALGPKCAYLGGRSPALNRDSGECSPRLLFTAQALPGGFSMCSEKHFQTVPPPLKK